MHFCPPNGSQLIIAAVLRPKPERLLVFGAGLFVVAQAPGRANFVPIDGVDGFFVVARGEAEFFELLGTVDVHTSLTGVSDRADRANEVGRFLRKLAFRPEFLLSDSVTITLAVWLVVDRHLKVWACLLWWRIYWADDHRRDHVPRN